MVRIQSNRKLPGTFAPYGEIGHQEGAVMPNWDVGV